MIEFLTPVSKPVIAHREVLPAGTIGKQLLVHAIKGELPDLEDVPFLTLLLLALLLLVVGAVDFCFLGDFFFSFFHS